MIRKVQAALFHPETSWRRKRSLSTAITVQIQITQAKKISIVQMTSSSG